MENKHTPYDLAQMQSLPLEAKIRMTKTRIRQWYDHWDGMVYVSFSGGKDSTVLKHIVDSLYDDVPALFVNTGLEFPEIQKFVRQIKAGKYNCFNSDVEIVRPEMRFDEVLKTYGYPVVSKTVSHSIGIAKRNPDGRVAKNIVFNTSNNGLFSCHQWNFLVDAPFSVSDECCNVMKKKPAKKYAKETGRIPFLGTMANESNLRYSAWLKNGCNAFEGKNPSSQPLSFWTEQDILEYIEKYNVPYCPVYGDIISDNDQLKTTGCSRTGCMFCMFGCHLEKGENRFQQLKKTHPKQYEYCLNGGEMVDGKWKPSKEGLGLGKVLDYIGVKYE
jgi:3'-phosphoadenosine 5'-phosphosulfate sulfotransferase (PAPS reductase)/FAD synthetase